MAANRNLRLLVLGQFVSAIGDNFYLIAIPWLGLQLTGSALITGTLLAAASIPRSIFLLLGGALTDRYSAKRLLILSNGLQGVLMVVFGFMILTPLVRLWLLYVLVFLSGFLEAFGLPAFNALLPRIVDKSELESGNIYLQGTNILSSVIGPVLAGLLISFATTSSDSQSTLNGLGVVFLINALTFFAGVFFFWRIRTGDEIRTGEALDRSLVASMRQVIEYIRRDPQLKTLMGLMMILGLFLTGTIRLGFPLLAETRFSGGVLDFGFMVSAFGAGILAGMIAVKVFPRPPRAISGIITMFLFAFLPLGMILLGFTLPLYASLAVIVVMGAAFGYVNIYLFSWLQRRTPSDLLGRVIAIVLFLTIGLSPISQVLMGFLLGRNLQATLIGVGSLVLLVLLAVSTNRKMWRLEE
jgi:MFS family permease